MHNGCIGVNCLVEYTESLVGSQVPEVLTKHCNLGVTVVSTTHGSNG